jgi:RHS repeat-associated protein
MPARVVPPGKATPDAEAGVSVKGPRQVTWPAAQSAVVDLDAAVAAPRADGAAVDSPLLVRAGGSPVLVGPARPAAGVAGADRDSLQRPGRIRVETLGRTKVSTVDTPLVRLSRPDGVAGLAGRVALGIDYRDFRHAYGGAWASRLRLARVPECALSTPDVSACAPVPIGSVNDTAAGRVTGEVALAVSGSTMVALIAAGGGGSGTYTATTLSASATWTAGGSSGDFNWSYPLRVPPGLGGPTPQISLSYSSGSVDGRNNATNNQPSWVGIGFEFWPGQIERKYKPCATDLEGAANNKSRPTGDQCWFSDNATMVLNGGGGELVRVGTSNVWRPKKDDGSRVELLTDATRANGDDNGEYWRVTTADGTQYHFGYHNLPGWTSGRGTDSVFTVPVYGNHPGEPCYQASFQNSGCRQAYRWNLDYVVDVHGNTMSYHYGRETNKYARYGEANSPDWYDRGGYLRHIEYGQRSDAIFTTPPVGRVVFDVVDRCTTGASCSLVDALLWPDVPTDQHCGGTSCVNQFSPSFWTQKRLAKITTQVLNDNGVGHRPVESWTLRQSYVDPDDATGAAMWLDGITHTGHGTGAGQELTLPELTFDGEFRKNRVDDLASHISPLNWRRINAVTTETGGKLAVVYNPAECSQTNVPAEADTNTKLCMPVKGADDAFPDRVDWFHKYMVGQITQTDTTSHGGARPIVTRYEYLGQPAWHFDDIDGIVPIEDKTWAQWRGYGRVRTRVGDGTDGPVIRTESLYFRGMDGDRTASGGAKDVWVEDSRGPGYRFEDHDGLAGLVREAVSFSADSDTAVLARTITDPWRSDPTATQTRPWGNIEARRYETGAVHTYRTIDNGTGTGTRVRETEVRNGIEPDGRISQVHDRGDVADANDDLCTKFWHVTNPTVNLVNLTTRVQKLRVGCDQSPQVPRDIAADNRSFYDGSDTHGTVRTRGLVTRIDELAGFSGTTINYRTRSRVGYDAVGRVVSSTDLRGNTSLTAYTPADRGPVTKVTTTDPLGVVTYQQSDPAWGAPLVDGNQTHNVRTRVTLDALGRVYQVRGPTRSDADSPDAEFGYHVVALQPVVVTTRKLQPGGNYQMKYELFDGLLRPRQTQLPAVGGGSAVADSFYDSRGLLVERSGPYKNDAPPDFAVLQPPLEGRLPNQIRTEFDGAGRATNEILSAGNGSVLVEKWRTTTTYGGDRVSVKPPRGGTATMSITDARNRPVELRQYHGPAPTGTFDATRYAYNKDGQPLSVTDPAGNVWSYSYDELGRLKRTTDPDRGDTEFGHNQYDEQTTVTDSRQRTLTTAYDTLGRPSTLHEGTTLRVSWTYDTVKLGLPTGSSRWVGTDEYRSEVAEYDPFLRPKRSRIVIPPSEGALAGTYEFGAEYATDGQVSKIKLPAGGRLPAEDLTIGYNEFGLPTTLTGAAPYVTGTSYTPFAEPTVVMRNNPVGGNAKWFEERFYYDTATRRLTQTQARTKTSGAPISITSYEYDPMGNITKVADAPPNQTADTQCFAYDHLRRLTEAWTPAADCTAPRNAATLAGPAPYWHSYTYDKTGNRTTETRRAATGAEVKSTYSYPPAAGTQPHTLTGVTTTGGLGTKTLSFGYDSTGNTTRRVVDGAVQTLEWDAEGKLARLVDSSGETRNLYDADGNRLIRRDSSGTTLYLGPMELHRSTFGTVSATRYYEHDGRTVAVRTDDNKLTWLASDHQGTNQIAVDFDTQTFQRRRSTPFGDLRGAGTPAWPGDKGFVGGTTDKTGLTNVGARQYDTYTGRFVSVDPIVDPADPQQMHGYAYSNNNPTTFSDPSGLLLVCGKGGDLGGTDCGGPGNIPGDIAGNILNNNPGNGNNTPNIDPKLQKDKEEAEAVKKKSILDILKEQGLAFLFDFLGITDIINCFTKGDLGACVSTLVGLIPWGKIFKAGKAIVSGVKRAWNAYRHWQARLKWADDVLKRADDAMAAARKKADEAAEAAGKKADEAAESAGDSCRIGNSFTPGTAVLMADGSSRPIEDIEAGDKVLAIDPVTGSTEAKSVTMTISGDGAKALVEVTVDTDGGAGGATAVLTATDGHPFWVDNAKTWRDAVDLQPGDSLRTPDGARVRVIAVVAYGAIATVHNLTVADIHTYHVVAGNTPILVHNCNDPTVIAVNSAGEAEVLPAFEIDPVAHAPQAASFTRGTAAGAPAILTRGAGGTADAANRAAAQAHAPRPTRFGRNATWEEYPYASSVEGGRGATLTLSPRSTNSSHGSLLRWFFARNGIGPGGRFAVRVRR